MGTINFVFIGFLYLLEVFSIVNAAETNEAGKISLSVPHLSEEETNSNHMPHHLRCDACRAVSFQMEEELSKEHEKRSTLKEYDILDVFERLCSQGFTNYGVKQVDGVNRLSGPGLDTEKVMGMTQMGGRWPHRLQEMCHYYVGEAGELDIYTAFKNGKGEIFNYLCYGKGIFSHCRQAPTSVREEF